VKTSHSLVAATVVLAVACVAALPAAAHAGRGFKAFVYPDRTRPDLVVSVDDFRINETVWDEGGVQYVWVRGPAGNFQVPFSRIRQIEFERWSGLDASRPDWVWYDVKVTGLNPGEGYTGRLDVRVMRGVAAGVPWYSYPATDATRGRLMYRIVFGDVTAPPTIPWEAQEPAAVPPPPAVVVPQPAAPPAPPAPSEDDLFARLSIDDLNRQKPLDDVFFDFDKSNIRPDAEITLVRNAAWLKRWPSVTIRVDGCADPRGTAEYNLGLGMRRADTVRAFLAAQGVSVDRVEVLSVGESQLVCTEQTEECWARNRAGRFHIIAK